MTKTRFIDLCEANLNKYIRLDFGTRETIHTGYDFIKNANADLLCYEVMFEEEESDYYDIYAYLL